MQHSAFPHSGHFPGLSFSPLFWPYVSQGCTGEFDLGHCKWQQGWEGGRRMWFEKGTLNSFSPSKELPVTSLQMVFSSFCSKRFPVSSPLLCLPETLATDDHWEESCISLWQIKAGRGRGEINPSSSVQATPPQGSVTAITFPLL